MSGQPICRIGDMSLGTCGKPAIPALQSNTTAVFVNGRPPIVVTSYRGTHCDDDCHDEFCVIGNPTVLISGKAVDTMGKVLSAGDMAGQGSSNVLA